MHDNRKLDSTWWALRVTYGVIPVVAGLDKFFNLLANWPGYLSPLAARTLPFAPATFMYIAGVVEVLVGLAVLSRWTRQAAYVASVWLVLIALNLLSTGHFLDIAVRDLAMAVGAFSLARLDELRAEARGTRGVTTLRTADVTT